jgi:hypothetical protein
VLTAHSSVRAAQRPPLTRGPCATLQFAGLAPGSEKRAQHLGGLVGQDAG